MPNCISFYLKSHNKLSMAAVKENLPKNMGIGREIVAGSSSSPIVSLILRFIAGPPITKTDRIPRALLPGSDCWRRSIPRRGSTARPWCSAAARTGRRRSNAIGRSPRRTRAPGGP